MEDQAKCQKLPAYREGESLADWQERLNKMNTQELLEESRGFLNKLQKEQSEYEALRKNDGWYVAGYIPVDAGICWVGDPGYILHTKLDKSFGKNWNEFCDLLKDGTGKRSSLFRDFRFGVCTDTGIGDGMYPVYVKIKDGMVSQVLVDFLEEFDLKKSNETL